MQITNNSNGSGVRVNLIKGVSSEFIAEALIRINEQELNIIGYNSQTKTYRDEASVLRDNAQSSAYNANNSALLSTVKANEANLSANNAKEWASKEYGLEVETGLYSAKHYAIEASNNTSKVTSINGMIGDVVLSKSDVGLWSVDNTSDINKPISNDTQTALDLKANVVNAVLTGIPTAPTAPVGTNTTQLATTAFVNAEIANDTYSKTQLDGGQLDNRYYTEAEIDAKLSAQNDASEIGYSNTSSGLVATKVQDAIDEVESRLDVAETKIANANISRADKYLASQNVVRMIYNLDGKLSKVRYNNNSDVDYEVLTYNTDGKLSNVGHYLSSVLKGNTVLSYENGKLVSAPYIAI